MPKSNVNELRQKPEAELRKELARLRDELSSLRVKIKLAQAKDPHRLRAMRKDIARIMTILNSKQTAE